MKNRGVVRNVDNLGRIVIPVELRRMLSIDITDPVEITVEDNKVIVKKYEPWCVFCGNSKGVKVFQDKNLCPSCIEKIKELW